MPKPYKKVVYRGKPARLYEDGHIRDERGYILKRSPAWKNFTPGDRAKAAHEKGLKVRRNHRELRKALANFNPEKYGLSAIVARAARIALVDDGQLGNECAEIVLQALGVIRK